MSADLNARRALVLGGSGAVGSAVVRALCARGVSVTYTWLRSEATVAALSEETGAVPLRVDLRDAAALQAALSSAPSPDLLIHCALHAPLLPLSEITLADWDDTHAVNVRSLFIAIQRSPDLRDIVLTGALDRGQSLPLPLSLAAAQGALAAIAMSLAWERPTVRTNLVALGPLTAGLSARLPPSVLDDYRTYSALGRLGAPEEAARTILWLALDNPYMSGKVLSLSGI